MCKPDELQENAHCRSHMTRSSLHSAVQKGNLAQVMSLLSRGFSVHVTDTLETTLLHVACLRRDYPMVELLLRYDAKVDARDFQGMTPIHIAADAGDLNIFQLLLHAPGIDNKVLIRINIKTPSNQTPLHFAALRGHLHVIKYIIQNGGVENAIKLNGYTPLIMAVIGTQPEAVRELVKYETNFNANLHYRNLIFMAIASESYFALISCKNKVLQLKKGLPLAKQLRSVEIIDILMDAGCPFIDQQVNRVTPLYYALNYKHDLIVRKLIERGCNINKTCENGRSPIHKAAHSSYPNTVKTLINAGADVNKACVLGLKAIHYMAMRKNYKVLSALLQAGADINSSTTFDKTIVDIFTGHNYYKSKHAFFLYIILEYGFNINATNIIHNTALCTLCLFDHRDELSCVMIDWFLDFNVLNIFGSTPLQNFILYSFDTLDQVKSLIKLIVVMEKTKNFKISSLNMNLITFIAYHDFYEECQKELETTKINIVWSEVSFFAFLQRPLKEVRELTRNDDLMKVINSGILNSFLLYGDLIKQRVHFAIKLRNLHDKGCIFLGKIFYPFSLPLTVAYEILRFLNVDEMEKLSYMLKIRKVT